MISLNRNVLPTNKPQETSWLHLSHKSINVNSDSKRTQHSTTGLVLHNPSAVEIPRKPWCSKQNRFCVSEEPLVSSLALPRSSPFLTPSQNLSACSAEEETPLYRRAHPCSHILQLLLLPGNQHQSHWYSCGNARRALPQDVTCAGYWEDITECHRLQISMRLSLSVRATITQQRTKRCAQSLPLIYRSCVLITAEAVLTADYSLILIISFAIKKLTALNHPFHIWHFHKGLLYENFTLKGEFTQKLTFLSSVFLRNIKGGVW